MGVTPLLLLFFLVCSSRGDNASPSPMATSPLTGWNPMRIKTMSSDIGTCSPVQGDCGHNVLIKSGQMVCGGALISPKFVLTAARCITPGADIILVPGATSNKAYMEQITVNDSVVYFHQRCSLIPGFEPVIALIELPDDTSFLANARTIRLPKSSQKSPGSFNNLRADVCGWREGQNGTLALHRGTLLVADHSKCRSAYNRDCEFQLDYSHICASSPMICASSGSPLSVREKDGLPTLVGLHLWTPTLEHNNLPELYTYVGNHIDWILAVTNIQPRR